MPFARGGVVSRADEVSDARRRRADGRGGAGGDHAAGARAPTAGWACAARAAARPVNVVMNITTPDAEGFRRIQSQIAAQMGRALGRGQRNR